MLGHMRGCYCLAGGVGSAVGAVAAGSGTEEVVMVNPYTSHKMREEQPDGLRLSASITVWARRNVWRPTC